MNIAILGYDRQGKSAYRHWRSPDNQLIICDKNEQIAVPDDCDTQLGNDYLNNLNRFDLLVRTPGLHPGKIIAANPETPGILDKVTTVTNEFFSVCPTRNIIGVTGTKGKGTTSTLIAHMLTSAGKRVHLGGNIGLAPLQMLDGAGFMGGTAPDEAQNIQPDDWVVLELANFQLIDIKHSPHIAICLMVVPEHLDWHNNIDEYLRAKQQLFTHQTEDDTAIYHPHNNRSLHLATTSLGTHLPYLTPPGAHIEQDAIVINGHTICHVNDVTLPGTHNLENICAAVTAAWQVTQNVSAIAQAIKQAKSLPFRIEKRLEKDGVTYYNDSFAVNPDATIAAIKAIKGSKIMLLGGLDRGLDFTELAKEIANQKNHVKHTVIYGKAKHQIKQALDREGYKDTSLISAQKLAKVVRAAEKAATTGDTIMLSPACASFDMFKNFEERGNEFNRIIEQP